MRESPYVREPGYALRYRDRRFRCGTGATTDRRERAALRALLQHATPTNGVWLDAPAGAGRLTDELPGTGVRVDRDRAMLLAADERHPRICASVHALPFADRCFAGTICMRLLQHIATPVERIDILRELNRVTRGPIVVSFFDSRSLQHLRRRLRPLLGKRPSGRSAVSRRAFVAELRAAGLVPVAVRALARGFAEQTLVLCLRRRA